MEKRQDPQYREHIFTEGEITADSNALRGIRLSDDEYKAAHAGTVIATHDAVITYQGGVVLMERTGAPLKGFLWLPGGRITRGVMTEESLKSKVKKECGLVLTDLVFAGVERAFMPTDPFNHGHGSDTIGLVYFAEGRGQAKADSFHTNLRIITPPHYDGVRESIHPFVRKYTDEAITKLRSV